MGLANFFKRLTKSKDPNSKRSRWDMAQMICGKHIRYVSEKQNDVDVIIGREGGFNIREEDLLVFASSKVASFMGFSPSVENICSIRMKGAWVVNGLFPVTGRSPEPFPRPTLLWL